MQTQREMKEKLEALQSKASVRILAMESSCDETAAAIVENGRHIVSSVIFSQVDTHALYGGVVPEIASRAHMDACDRVIDRALQEAGMALSDVDALAVTYGPGLVGALLTAVSYAKALAYARHYPAINWTSSYSEYLDDLAPWYAKNISRDFLPCRQRISTVLLEEAKLNEIVKLIGEDVLPDDQKLIMEVARLIRVGLLQQNAYHRDDTYVPLPKQLMMMQVILYFYDKASAVIAKGIPISEITDSGLIDSLVKIKYEIPNAHLELFDNYYKEIDDKLAGLNQL